MGSILEVFEANRKSESLKTVLDNLNFAIESMSREIRFGQNYHCSSASPLTSPLNCSNPGGNNVLSFLSSDGRQITYLLNGTRIQKSTDSINYIDVTAPEVTITGLSFYVLGAGTDTRQPKVILQVRGFAGTKTSTRTDFILETMVSQRLTDS